MTKIYLIRHAEAEGNLYRIAHGQEEGLITDYRGPRQMQALARRFRDIPVDAVYASDLIRTQTTAQAVYVPKGLPLHLEPAFREVHMGVWEGLTWRQIETRWPLQMMEFNHQLDRWQVEGCETAQTVLDRYLPALRRVAREHDGQTVAVFSHGAAMRIVLGTLQGLPLAEIGQSPHGDNTAVSLIEAQGYDLRVVFRDDNSHLTAQEGLSTFGKQTWWKTKGMVEPGQLYRPASHEQSRLFGAPEGGQGTAVWYNGQELIGLYQTVREPDALRITWYAMDPMWRGRRQGIPPMGQIIQQGRRLGLPYLRLTCTDESLRPFWQRLGFRGDGAELEKDIRLQIPDLRQCVMECSYPKKCTLSKRQKCRLLRVLLLYGWVLRLVRLAEALLQLPQARLHLLEAGQVRLRQGLLGQGQLLAELAVQLGILGPGLGAPGLLLPGQLPQLLDGLGPELLRPPVGADLLHLRL